MKLELDQLGEPSVGWLTIERWRLSNRFEDRWVRSAVLRCGQSRGASYLIPAIHGCELTAMEDRGFLLSGREDSDHLQDPGMRQTWWCRPVSEQSEAGQVE